MSITLLQRERLMVALGIHADLDDAALMGLAATRINRLTKETNDPTVIELIKKIRQGVEDEVTKHDA